MKVYIAGPLFSEADIRQRLHEGKVLREAGFSIFNPIEQPFNTNKQTLPTPEDIFLGDYQAIKDCDVIFADLHQNDPGVVAELGLAFQLGKKIIAVDSDIRVPSANRYDWPTYGVNHFVLGLLLVNGSSLYRSFEEGFDALKQYANSK